MLGWGEGGEGVGVGWVWGVDVGGDVGGRAGGGDVGGVEWGGNPPHLHNTHPKSTSTEPLQSIYASPDYKSANISTAPETHA